MLANIQKLLVKYGMNFVNGLGTTLTLALISVAVGCLIGAIVAIMRLSKSKRVTPSWTMRPGRASQCWQCT